MAKQRNSLGILVLPVPTADPITWEEYKERYGVDLDKIFEIRNGGTDEEPVWDVIFKEGFSKIVAISHPSYRFIPSVSLNYGISVQSLSSKTDSYIIFSAQDVDATVGYNLSITANREVIGGEL